MIKYITKSFQAKFEREAVEKRAARKLKKAQKKRRKYIAKMKSKEKLAEIMNLITRHNCDGGHHKQWLLDQVVRVVQGNNYEQWRYDFEYSDGEGGYADEPIYSWDEGIP